MSHEHLSDEQLSAFLDGRASDGPSSAGPGGSSIAACARCRERLAALEGARDLVRTPVMAPSASARAAAIRAALSDASSPESAPDETAPLASVASVRRPERRSLLPLGAAAAVVALALAAGIPIALSHRGSTQTSSAAHGTGRRPATPPAPSAAAPSATAATAVPDLGSIGSLGALRSRLAPLASSSGPAGVFGTSSGLSTQNDSAQSATVPSPAAPGIPAPLAPCVDSARQKAGPDHSLSLVATATYDGTPALVVVFEVPAATSGSSPVRGSSPATQHLALVVARSDCRVLARTTF